MLKFDLESNHEVIKKRLSHLSEKRWGFYISKAANDTAYYVRNKLKSEMPKYIDRPNNFTLNSLAVKTGSKSNPDAEVYWKKTLTGHGAGRYLVPVANGGERRHKGFENQLMRSKLMPTGYYAIPAPGAPLDRHGNITQGTLIKILSYLRANVIPQNNRSYTKKHSSRRSRYFSIQPGNTLPAGIYERPPSSLRMFRPILYFVNRVKYRPQFPFESIASKASVTKFEQALLSAMAKYPERDQ